MEIDDKTQKEILNAVERDIPALAFKLDKIHDLLVGTAEMPEMGLIPRIKSIEEVLKDFGLLTRELNTIPDLAKRLLHIETVVMGANCDGKGGIVNQLEDLQKRPEKTIGRWKSVIAIIGGILGILSPMITAIIVLAKII